jgi:SAM-dependent methyltransferase
MDPQAMEPYGMAILAFFDGDTNAELLLRRDDGQELPLPVSHFFRDAYEFTPIDRAALDLCKGHVLDVGAGTGLHSLALQKEGLPVTAIDLNSQAVRIMKKRGVEDAHRADVFEFRGGPFDTILMMGHGLGIVETIDGLDRFLVHTRSLVSEHGQLLLDSLDVRVSDDPSNVAYLEANQRAGRYFGEIRLQVEFQGKTGPYYCWLHVDAEMLKQRAAAAGWLCDVILQGEHGDYLARLAELPAE